MDTTKSIKEEAVTYTSTDGTTLKGYVSYNENQAGPRPVVLVVPEWWGMTEYPRMRAKMLAEMGYIAMAVDMYGDGKEVANPTDALSAATPFYSNPNLGKARMDAALAKVKSFSQADTSQVAAIGYCFGGTMVLNYAKMGAPVAGVVSFHGGLEGVPPQKGTKTQFLICHGGADSFVPQPQVAAFKKSMDSAGVTYTFNVYANATHAFTNPNATEKGKEFKMPIEYNAAADSASWNDMKAFFAKIFHQ
ncbi:MAG: dienelactone hydrolase family protein [Chitinophagaceae bacterium]|nr:MAG: dienelactone hydrolase family protein [Chitinophagaceae bacterium]